MHQIEAIAVSAHPDANPIFEGANHSVNRRDAVKAVLVRRMFLESPDHLNPVILLPNVH